LSQIINFILSLFGFQPISPAASPASLTCCVPDETPTPTPSTTETVTPSPSASPTPSQTSTIIPTPTPSTTETATPSPSASPTPSQTSTITPTPTPSTTETATPSPSASPTPSQTSTVTPTPTPSTTETVTPSPSASPTPSQTSTITPTVSPTPSPSSTITVSPSTSPTNSPSTSPSPQCSPGTTPTICPSASPSSSQCQATPTKPFKKILPTKKNILNNLLNLVNNLINNLKNKLKIIPPPVTPSLCCVPICGDTLEISPEQCDDGNTNNDDSCRNDCTIPECGDGIIDPNGKDGIPCPYSKPYPSLTTLPPECCDDEECDEHSSIDTDCNGFINDDENSICTTKCKKPECGDGIVQPLGGDGKECNKVPDPECLALGGDPSTCDLIPEEGCDDEDCDPTCDRDPITCALGLTTQPLLPPGDPKHKCDPNCKWYKTCCLCTYQERDLCNKVNEASLLSLVNNPEQICKGCTWSKKGLLNPDPGSKEEFCNRLLIPVPGTDIMNSECHASLKDPDKCVSLFEYNCQLDQEKKLKDNKCEYYPDPVKEEDFNLGLIMGKHCGNLDLLRQGHGKPILDLYKTVLICISCLAEPVSGNQQVCNTLDTGCSTLNNLEQVKSYAEELYKRVKQIYETTGKIVKLSITGNQVTDVSGTFITCNSKLTIEINPLIPIDLGGVNLLFPKCSNLKCIISGMNPKYNYCYETEKATCEDDATGKPKEKVCCPVKCKNKLGLTKEFHIFFDTKDEFCPSTKVNTCYREVSIDWCLQNNLDQTEELKKLLKECVDDKIKKECDSDDEIHIEDPVIPSQQSGPMFKGSQRYACIKKPVINDCYL
jgi:hypothetical protein